jgi:hypothetical protein
VRAGSGGGQGLGVAAADARWFRGYLRHLKMICLSPCPGGTKIYIES